MGLFSFLGNNKKKGKKVEVTKMENGYEIGVDSGKIYHCPKGLTIYKLPNGAKSLSRTACDDMRATIVELEIPSSFSTFTEIDGDVYGINTINNFKKITFAEGITEINPLLFDRTKVSFNVPESVTHLNNGVYSVDADGKIIIGDRVTSIGEYCFASHDYRIQYVEIPGSVMVVPKMAFNQCKNIKTVILHEGVQKCEENAFLGTNKLTSVELPDTFNGTFDASMESRTGYITLAGQKYTYSINNIAQERESILTIKINRSGQDYLLKIKRGQFTSLFLNENNIKFKGSSSKLICEIQDISTLNPNDWHIISDGRIVSVTPLDSNVEVTTFEDLLIKCGIISPDQKVPVTEESQNQPPQSLRSRVHFENRVTESGVNDPQKLLKGDTQPDNNRVTVQPGDYERILIKYGIKPGGGSQTNPTSQGSRDGDDLTV